MRNYEAQLEKIIGDALEEDLGPGDYSTLSTINKGQKGSAILKVKD